MKENWNREHKKCNLHANLHVLTIGCMFERLCKNDLEWLVVSLLLTRTWWGQPQWHKFQGIFFFEKKSKHKQKPPLLADTAVYSLYMSLYNGIHVNYCDTYVIIENYPRASSSKIEVKDI